MQQSNKSSKLYLRGIIWEQERSGAQLWFSAGQDTSAQSQIQLTQIYGVGEVGWWRFGHC